MRSRVHVLLDPVVWSAPSTLAMLSRSDPLLPNHLVCITSIAPFHASLDGQALTDEA